METSLGSAPRQLGLMLQELGRLSDQELTPEAYYARFFEVTLPVLGAVAGAAWVRTSLGDLRLLQQASQPGIAPQWSDAWCQQLVTEPSLLHVPAHTVLPGDDTTTTHHALLAPISVDSQVVGVLEVWEKPDYALVVVQNHLQLLGKLAEFGVHFTKQQQRRLLLEQQKHWTALEDFCRQVHGSLNPTEVAFLVANEARRLIGCDRVSVILRRGQRTRVEAVSGVEVVDPRANVIERLRVLGEQVMTSGARLVYRGVRDASLAPPVFAALDGYVAESPCQQLVVLPLESEGAKAHAALVAESFQTTLPADMVLGRLEVLGRHASSALANAYRHERIPMHRLGDQTAWLIEGAGGPVRAAGALVLLGMLGLIALLTCVSYPLKIEARGQLLPRERRWVYSPVEAQVMQFEDGIQPGRTVLNRQSLMLLYDTQLELKLLALNHEIAGAEQEIAALSRQQASAVSEIDRLRFSTDRKRMEYTRDRKIAERRALNARTNADESRPGYFWLKAPLAGTILSWDFREKLNQRFVKPSEPLLRIGALDKRWEVELRLPEKHVGHLLNCFAGDPEEELDVDLLLLSDPTRTFRGKLARMQMAGEAVLNQDGGDDAEPFVLASVRLDGEDIPEAERIPAEMLITGTEVHSKVRCGDRAMGYSLFHGVWEFFYEKVVFFFQ